MCLYGGNKWLESLINVPLTRRTFHIPCISWQVSLEARFASYAINILPERLEKQKKTIHAVCYKNIYSRNNVVHSNYLNTYRIAQYITRNLTRSQIFQLTADKLTLSSALE